MTAKKSRKHKSTQKATLKKAYFSRFGIEAVPKIVHKESTTYLRKNLEPLTQIILPDEVVSVPLQTQMSLEMGFALGEARYSTLNR